MRSTLQVLLSVLVCSCGRTLPRGQEEFTLGRTHVRTDSMLDVVGVLYRMADTSTVPARGPVRHWLEALQTHLNDSAVHVARAPGPIPVSLVLETWSAPSRPDTVCGSVTATERRCFSGNEPVRAQVRRIFDAAPSFAPLTVGLEDLSAQDRQRDLADVWNALTRSASIDSAVLAYSGYGDLTFDVTLARTLSTGITTSSVDPARALGSPPRLYLTPDAFFASRSFRSPSYIFLSLGHQMMHRVVQRLFTEHPELLEHGFAMRNAVAPEMSRLGYDGLLWNEVMGEQLARALSIRLMQLTFPSIGWAARSQALESPGLAMVPYLEDALMRYEKSRAQYPNLSAFAGELARALDSIPMDPCRAAPAPGVGLVGVARHRAVVAWMADDSPFRAKRLLVGDTVLAVDGDSVSSGGLLVPTRQVMLAWAKHLPYELGILDIRRGGHVYSVQAPVSWGPRQQIRIAAQGRVAVTDTLPICRWVTRAKR